MKRDASLGANCTIVSGNTIGKSAFVGAGAVVTKNVPDYALVVGNPARIIGWMCSCGNHLELRSDIDSSDTCICRKCGIKYEKSGIHISEIT